MYQKIINNLDYDEKTRARGGNFYCEFDERDGALGFKHTTIVFALEEQGKGSASNDYKMVLNLCTYREVTSITKVEWEGENLKNINDLRDINEFEVLLTSLYFNKTKIEMDIDEEYIDTCICD